MNQILELIAVWGVWFIGCRVVRKAESSSKYGIRVLMKILMTLGIMIALGVLLLCIWATLGYAKEGEAGVAIKLGVVTAIYAIALMYLVYQYIKKMI